MIVSALWVCWLVAALETPSPPVRAANDELRAYLAQAAEHNPELRARHQAWQAALLRIPQVKSLSDPMFTIEQSVTADAFAPRMTLQQTFPWFGALRAQGDKAAAEAEAALQAFFVQRDLVFLEVKRAYYELGFLAGQIQVMENQIQIMAFMEDLVRSKLALGLAMDDELIRVSMRKTGMEDRLKQMQGMKTVFDAQLDAALGAEETAERPWPAALPDPPEAPALEDIVARLQKANPELEQYKAMGKSWEEQARIAKKQGLPNLTFMLDYRVVPSPSENKFRARDALTGLNSLGSSMTKADGSASTDSTSTDMSSTSTSMGSTSSAMPTSSTSTMANTDGRDEVMVTLGVSLPIWRKRIRAGIEEANLRADATLHEKQRATQDLRAQAREALFNLQDAHRRHALYTGSLVPQALRALDSLQQTYASGPGDTRLLDVLDAAQTLLDFKLEEARALRDGHIATAELERITGGTWPDSIAQPVIQEAKPE